MSFSKALLIAAFIILGVFAYQTFQNQKHLNATLNQIDSLGSAPYQDDRGTKSQQTPVPSHPPKVREETKNSQKQNISTKKTNEKIPSGIRQEMLNFQESPEFIQYSNNMKANLKKFFKSPGIQEKLSTYLAQQMSQPVDPYRTQKTNTPVLSLSQFEISEVKDVLKERDGLKKEDAETYYLVTLAAVKADNDPQSKAETLGYGIQSTATNPEEIFYPLQTLLQFGKSEQIDNKYLIEQIKSSLSLQKDARTKEILNKALEDLQ